MLYCCLPIPFWIVFLPYGQVGVGIPRSLEAATFMQLFISYISKNYSDSIVVLLKVGMKRREMSLHATNVTGPAKTGHVGT